MRTLKAVAYSYFLAMWLEFFYKFGATFDPKNFIGAGLIYPFYIAALFGFFKILRLKSKILIFCIGGVIGLMAEWFIIGNAPWVNPNALQLGMFVFHALYPALGYYYLHRMLCVKDHKFIFKLFTLFTFISLGGFLIPHQDIAFAWFIFMPLLSYFIGSGKLTWQIFLDYRKKPS